MDSSQKFPTMLGSKPKPFNCAVCHQEHTYGSWEDAEIFFDDKMSIHLGCLQSHYKELVSKTKLAYENATSLCQLMEKTHDNISKNTSEPEPCPKCGSPWRDSPQIIGGGGGEEIIRCSAEWHKHITPRDEAYTHLHNTGLPILRDIITNLKGAIHE